MDHGPMPTSDAEAALLAGTGRSVDCTLGTDDGRSGAGRLSVQRSERSGQAARRQGGHGIPGGDDASNKAYDLPSVGMTRAPTAAAATKTTLNMTSYSEKTRPR